MIGCCIKRRGRMLRAVDGCDPDTAHDAMLAHLRAAWVRAVEREMRVA